MFELRDYQQEAIVKGRQILKEHGLLILNYEVRTGKSHIALGIGERYKKVLFVTKKKAIGSIEGDYAMAGYNYHLEVVNYEQLHKFESGYDLVIFDESHCLSALGKPSLRTKEGKRICDNKCDVILMTGTLLPENNAQIFHQLWVSSCSPFANYRNFYRWFEAFGKPKMKYTSYGTMPDYTDVPYDKIKPYIEPIMLTYTQSEAGFVSNIIEHFCSVEMLPATYLGIAKLKKDKLIEGKHGIILADQMVKEMSKVHQMFSGTVKYEDQSSIVFDDSKAIYIKEKFAGKKLAIFYKFKAELDAIKQHLDITDSIEEFNTTDKHIALQIVSGREGINLSKADAIVYYNIDFSAVSYWQSRDRMTTITRSESNVYWIFAKGGIEWQIYKAVSNKKDFVLQTYKNYARE
jgi:hypothetical protein